MWLSKSLFTAVPECEVAWTASTPDVDPLLLKAEPDTSSVRLQPDDFIDAGRRWSVHTRRSRWQAVRPRCGIDIQVSHRGESSTDDLGWSNPILRDHLRADIEWSLKLSSYWQVLPMFEHAAMFRLAAMYLQPDGYDSEFRRPSVYAVRVAHDLLPEAQRRSRRGRLDYEVSTLGDGGLHLYFTHGERNVVVNIRPDRSRTSYIYHGDESRYEVDYEVTAIRLVHWLEWMVEE